MRELRSEGHWAKECKNPHVPRPPKGVLSSFVYASSNEAAATLVLLNGLATSIIEGVREISQPKAASSVLLTLPAGQAIVDPGAGQDLIGLPAFEKVEAAWAKKGVRVVRLDVNPPPASGVGGKATPLFCALVPVFLAGNPWHCQDDDCRARHSTSYQHGTARLP